MPPDRDEVIDEQFSECDGEMSCVVYYETMKRKLI
jgi:hypothetical protein